jgi:V8-like Glu-specific endopeptidase
MLTVTLCFLALLGVVFALYDGVEASQGQFPFLVQLRINYDSGGGFVCGGALISKRHVISSAHCSYFPQNTEAIVGVTDLSKATSDNIIRVTSTVRPSNFGVEAFDANDVAIYTLSRDVPEVSGSVSYASIGTTTLVPGDAVTVVGYGQIAFERLPTTAHYKNTKISVNSKCRFSDFYPPLMYCLADGGIQGCFGDSGTPVVIGNTLVGVMSYGNTPTCGDATAMQVVSKLSAMGAFIRQNTQFVKFVANAGGGPPILEPDTEAPVTTAVTRVTVPTSTKLPTQEPTDIPETTEQTHIPTTETSTRITETTSTVAGTTLVTSHIPSSTADVTLTPTIADSKITPKRVGCLKCAIN